MTERCLEIAIAKIWLKKNAKNIIEIGALLHTISKSFMMSVILQIVIKTSI